MAFDEKLAERVRAVLDAEPRVEEKKMFGGLCFMVRGHMSVGIVDDELMVRVGGDAYDEALKKPHAREMDFTGKPLRGMVYVAKPGIKTKRQLESWVERGAAFARSQPIKAKKKAAKKVGTRKKAAKKKATRRRRR